MNTQRLLIVDDHPGFRHGLRELLADLPKIAVCGEADNATTALAQMRLLKPDVAIIGISMPGANGIELIKRMLAEEPKLRILVVSVHDESLYGLRALRSGAKGYVMKQQPLDELLHAVQSVVTGGTYVSPKLNQRFAFEAIHAKEIGFGTPIDSLSDRELEVLQMIGRGFSTREIAEELHLSAKTIETHRANIKGKLGYGTSEEVVKFAIQWVAMQA